MTQELSDTELMKRYMNAPIDGGHVRVPSYHITG